MHNAVHVDVDVRALVLIENVLVVPVLVPDNVLRIAEAVGDGHHLCIVRDLPINSISFIVGFVRILTHAGGEFVEQVQQFFFAFVVSRQILLEIVLEVGFAGDLIFRIVSDPNFLYGVRCHGTALVVFWQIEESHFLCCSVSIQLQTELLQRGCFISFLIIDRRVRSPKVDEISLIVLSSES